MFSWGPSWTTFSSCPHVLYHGHTEDSSPRSRVPISGHSTLDSVQRLRRSALSASEEGSGAWSGVSAGPGLYYSSDPDMSNMHERDSEDRASEMHLFVGLLRRRRPCSVACRLFQWDHSRCAQLYWCHSRRSCHNFWTCCTAPEHV